MTVAAAIDERYVLLRTPEGTMRTFVARPQGTGPSPAVVMFQNVGGHGEVLLEMARRVASAGYYCVLPDLYYRLGQIVIDPDSRDEHVLAVRKAVLDSLSDAKVMEDTKAVLAHLDADPAVKPGPRGSIGYCMGGRFCIQAGALFPEVFRAAGSLFGTRMMTEAPDSPHRLLGKLRGEVYFGFAEHDHALSLEKAHEFIELLKRQCTAGFRAEIHPGTHHGYAFPGRAVYQRAAAERSWEQIFGMFERQLRAAR